MQDFILCVCKLPWKNCHSYYDLIFGFTFFLHLRISDDCGAPIQNTTAELLTISQLWSKTHNASNPNPWLIYIFFCFLSLAWWQRFHYWHLKQLFFAVVLWSCKSIFRSDLILKIKQFCSFRFFFSRNVRSKWCFKELPSDQLWMNDKPLSAQSKSSLFEALWQAIKMFWSFKSASNLGTLNLENKSVELLGPNACKKKNILVVILSTVTWWFVF